MSSVSGYSGVYAVDWAQTAPGEEWGLDPKLMSIGMSWRWEGEARRLDAATETLLLDRSSTRADPRRRARRRMRRLALAEMPWRAEDPDAFDPLPGNSMTLTDGARLYHARLICRGGRRLAVFEPLMPPQGRELWVAALNLEPNAERRPVGVICFLPGTLIDTPGGPRAVETLEPGDRIDTRDSGPQPLVWRGETHLSGAELYLHPSLRPLRIRAGALDGGGPDVDLLVSPGHRLLLPAPAALTDERELLVAAGDLEDGRTVRRDFSLTSVRYVHLMLERHEILTANGLPCESFHPGMADATVLAWHARSLEKAAPGLMADPVRFGPPARRCLDRGEAAILRHALA